MSQPRAEKIHPQPHAVKIPHWRVAVPLSCYFSSFESEKAHQIIIVSEGHRRVILTQRTPATKRNMGRQQLPASEGSFLSSGMESQQHSVAWEWSLPSHLQQHGHSQRKKAELCLRAYTSPLFWRDGCWSRGHQQLQKLVLFFELPVIQSHWHILKAVNWSIIYNLFSLVYTGITVKQPIHGIWAWLWQGCKARRPSLRRVTVKGHAAQADGKSNWDSPLMCDGA